MRLTVGARVEQNDLDTVRLARDTAASKSSVTGERDVKGGKGRGRPASGTLRCALHSPHAVIHASAPGKRGDLVQSDKGLEQRQARVQFCDAAGIRAARAPCGRGKKQ